MQRRLRFLSIALAAGAAALIAAVMPLLVQSSPPQQVQYTKTTSVHLPGIMSMFGGKPSNETTTVSATRKRTDSGSTSEIYQCDLKRVIHLDNNAKTYYVMTFDQMRAEMAAMQAQMQAQMAQRGSQTAPPASMAPIQGSGGLTLSVNTVNDPNTQQIFGMTAHHVTETITGTTTGTGQCPSGTLSMTNDEWYVPNPITFSCPLPRPPTAMMPPKMPQGGGRPQTNPCLSSFQVQASGKAHSEDRFALKQDTTIDIGVKMTTHEEVTKYVVGPYDPSAFDIPAGYSQVQPPANPYSGH